MAGFNQTIPTSESESILAPKFGMFASNFMYYTVAGPWSNNTPLAGVVQGCPGICRAKIRAPTLVPTCSTYTYPVDYRIQYDFERTEDGLQGPPHDALGIIILNTLLDGPSETIDLITGYSEVRNCTGLLHLTACTLRSGIGIYDVIVDGDTVSLPWTAEPKIVAVANNTATDHGLSDVMPGHPSTLAGISDFAQGFWASTVAFEARSGQIKPVNWGSSGHRYAIRSDNEQCPSFRDPRLDVMKSLNALMVYTGALVALHDPSYAQANIDPGLKLSATTLGYLQGSQEVFSTNYKYGFAALTLVSLSIALISPTYWGWWR